MKTLTQYILVVGLFVVAGTLGNLVELFNPPLFFDWKSIFMFIAGICYVRIINYLEE